MTGNEFTGMLLSAVAVLAGFVSIVWKCIKPINDLNLNIVKLTSAIEKLTDNDERQDERLRKHGEQIDELNKINENHEQRIIALEKK